MDNTTSNGTVHEMIYPSEAGYIIFGLIETICFIIGAAGSALIMSYFVAKTKDESSGEFLNICISCTDLIICLLSLSCAVSDFSYGDQMMFSSKFYCNVWGFLWNVSSKLSIFIIAVLSLARTICVTLPFCRVRRIHVAIPVFIYLLTLLIQSSTPFFFTAKGAAGSYLYVKSYTLCGFYVGDVFDRGTVEFQVFQYWVAYVNLLAPLPVIATSCCITVYKLKVAGTALSRTRSQRNSEGGKFKNEATITVVILTVIYLMFNTPLCLFWILGVHTTVLESVLPSNNFTADKIIFFNFIVMRSMCNVIAYYCRIKDLREHTTDVFRGAKKRLNQILLPSSRASVVEAVYVNTFEMFVRGVTSDGD